MMTPERWQHVKELLGTALELDPSKRPGYLDRACGSDATLRGDLERLLVAEQKAGPEFLNDPVILEELTLELPSQPHAWVGRRLGAYEIVEEIGAGGMGEVFRAVRVDDAYHKEVAIKLVRSGQDSSFAFDRFKNERQILASFDHPNIARMLDAGTTEEGSPYFVMELIQGERIDQYCDTQKLSTTERLKLFLPICSAVQYAHQHLVIHRDIKPGNILVNAEGVPKLLDFGIAKILESSEAAGQPEQTISLVRLLTPEYASPEQVKGEPITTASDVYSLGVLLYELLTGRTPYNVSTHTPHEISRAVCEIEPEKPSTAARRRQSPDDGHGKPSGDSSFTTGPEGSHEKLSKRLRGDLDNIVLMALRKEPQRRYASVEQFAEDIRRHLEHLPVAARKDTFGYRASKFIARHKAGVAAAAFVAVALFTAMGVTLREARIANRRFNDVRTLANSLIFDIHDSIKDLSGATAARKLIVQRAQEYLDRLTTDSNSDPALLLELSTAYARLANVLGDTRDTNTGDSEQALRNYRRVVELREAVVAAWPSNPGARRQLAQAYMELALAPGESRGETQNLLDKAVVILEPLAASHPDDLKIQYALGIAFENKAGALAAKGNWEEATLKYRESLAIYQRLTRADPKRPEYLSRVAFAHKHLGAMLINEKQLQPALEEYRAALSIDEAQIQADPQNVNRRYAITFTYSDIGFILGRQGDIAAALSYYGKAFDIRSAQAAADPQDTRARAGLAATYNYIARLLWQKGDLPAALEDEKPGA